MLKLESFYHFGGLNKVIFIKLNTLTNHGILPYILYGISNLFFIGNFAICHILICIYHYLKLKTSCNIGKNFISIYTTLVQIGICYTVFVLVFSGLKFFINTPRPFCSLKQSDFVTIVNIKSKYCFSSFPSAHTGISILILYALWPYLNKKRKVIFYFVIAFVATSRISLAMHYPADIIYSIIITLIVILVSNIIYKRLKFIIIDPIGKIIIRLIS